MLPSEFTELTGVTLTGEEYARVENAYVEMQMDKKDFCRMWLELRGNQFVEELIDAVNGLIKKRDVLESERNRADTMYRVAKVNAQDHLNDFGRKILCNLCSAKPDIYDILEEEFTLDFIVRVKLEEDFELLEHERNHLLSKISL